MADHDTGVVMNDDRGNEFGVLLYYKFAEIPHLQNLFEFYHSNCTSLSLLGRVRLSFHGVNVTIGGKMRALEKHIEALKPNTLFEGTDFKLASSLEPSNNQVAKECGFDSLSIRIVKELVTFSAHPLLKCPDISNAGKHLSAADFHSVLHAAGKFQEVSSGYNKEMVLLDARNVYETRIGKFHSPDVETLDPKIRQYSDLPSWIDNNSEQLRGKNILMYCTGGIRCELASAYIRSKGPGFENVFQLYGGIQRYMEQFSDGGYFKGKNFVFDHRVSVGSLNSDVLGACLLCGSPFDDYTSRCRCTYCRMLVLICNSCQESHTSYVCELCQGNGKPDLSVSSLDDCTDELIHSESINDTNRTLLVPNSTSNEGDYVAAMTGSKRKLRILCLHGFRQNASSFKGRTRSLAKKLKNIADFIFVDAPHELPFIYQRPPSADPQNSPPHHCNRKFAWLIAKDHDANVGSEWKMGINPFDPLQHQQQYEGFEKSIEYLKKIFAESGPIDGILGFSQGAAMAALVAANKERLKGDMDFRFVILCSGFGLKTMERFIENGCVNCPSLHIFSCKEGRDRQIDYECSKKVGCLFESRSSVIIEHDLGHIIPTKSPYIDQIILFLRRFI